MGNDPRTDLNRQADYWDSVAGIKTFTNPLDLNRFRELVPLTASILDIGCGYGRLCRELYESGYKNVIGVDISGKMIREGMRLFPHLDLRCLDSENFPFADESLDAVILFAVLTCITGDKGQRDLVDTVLQALKPDGLLLVSDYFLQNDRRNRIRYEKCHKKYGTYGVFELEDGAVVRHHARLWIEKLLSPFGLVSLHEMQAATMNGNPCRIFQYWGRKKTADV